MKTKREEVDAKEAAVLESIKEIGKGLARKVRKMRKGAH